MVGYYARLALKSCARDPGISLLIVLAIGLGIGVCVTMLTVYHAMAANPIWWKNDRLYAVTVDSWPADRPANAEQPQLPPTELTYTDATYFFNSTIPLRKVLMYPVAGVITGLAGGKPLKVESRVTSGDFFPAFDTPFRYGGGWSSQADAGPEPVAVISHELNARLFGGADSVGRTLHWNNRDFRVVGVLGPWHPLPRYYDLNTGNFDEPESVYVPWGWGKALQLRSSGTTHCWKVEPIDTFGQLLGSECAWLQMWVELSGGESVARMQALLDTYWTEQRSVGRFPRPRNNRLSNVSQWLEDNQVVHNDDRLMVGLAFAFLGVCLVNTVGLLLARFLAAAPLAGVRRALGASRLQVFIQHLVHVSLLALGGGLSGIGLSALFLLAIRSLYGGAAEAGRGGYQAVAQFDAMSIGWAIGLAVLAVLTAGVYPAWRAGRVPPATYLKAQ